MLKCRIKIGPSKIKCKVIGFVKESTKWIQYLLLVEFTYNNNSFQATIGMVPYEVLYGHKCKSPLYWDEVDEKQLVGPEIIQDIKDKVVLIRKKDANSIELSKELC
jgi:hypothetical protein